MKAATVSQLRKELVKLDHDELLDVCVRMAKFKVESKELLTYLLMKADDEIGYANDLCSEIDEHLNAPGRIHKKTLRKVVKMDGQVTAVLRLTKKRSCKCEFTFVDESRTRESASANCRVSANMYATQLKQD